MRRKDLFFFTLGAGIVAAGLWGLSVGSLTSFTAGTPIRASEVNANFSTLRSAIEALEQPVGVSRLAVGGTIGDGKVLKAQGGNLVWGDDATGAASFGTSLTGSDDTNPGFRVRNNANLGVGVQGEVADTGWGVRGIAGIGIGVEGEANTEGGAGVSAKAAVPGATALLIQGSIGVHGTTRPAFIHVVNNTSGNHAVLDHPLLNGDPNAILIVTYVRSSTEPHPVINAPFGVSYDNGVGRWRIFRADGNPMPLDARFNVLVIKQL